MCALFVVAPGTAAAVGDVNRGLSEPDVRSLVATPDGSLLVGARGVIHRSPAGAYDWRVSLLLRSRGGVTGEETGPGEDLFEISYEERVDLRLEELIEELREELTSELAETFFDSALLEEVVEDEIEARLDELRDLAEAEVTEEFATLDLDDEERVDLDEEVLDDDTVVHHLFAPSDRLGTVIASAGSGLYVTLDDGRRWRSVTLGGTGEDGGAVRAAASRGNTVWAVTEQGLFRGGLDSGRLQADQSVPLGSAPVFVTVCGDRLVVVDESALHERDVDAEGAWRRETPPVGAGAVFRHLLCSGGERVLATSGGVYRHDGSEWARLTDNGLPSRDVRMTHRSRSGRLWAATSQGAVWLDDGGWRADPGVPRGTSVRWMVDTVWGAVVLATDVGLIEVTRDEDVDLRSRALAALEARWAMEPSFHEAYRAALHELGAEELTRASWAAQDAAWSRIPPRMVRLEGRADRIREARGERLDVFPAATLRRTYRQPERDQWSVTLRLQWDLGRPVDATRGVQFAQNDRRLIALERRLQARMLRLWQQRRAAQLALAAASESPLQARVRLAMRVDRLSAELDGLTGHRFGFRHSVPQSSRSE